MEALIVLPVSKSSISRAAHSLGQSQTQVRDRVSLCWLQVSLLIDCSVSSCCPEAFVQRDLQINGHISIVMVY